MGLSMTQAGIQQIYAELMTGVHKTSVWPFFSESIKQMQWLPRFIINQIMINEYPREYLGRSNAALRGSGVAMEALTS